MGTSSESLNMKAMILASFLAAAALAAPEARFSCSECVDEMHKLDGWSRWELSQSMTMLRPTTAQPLERTRAGVRRPSQDTMLACCLPLLSTTLWMEPSMFVRLEGLV